MLNQEKQQLQQANQQLQQENLQLQHANQQLSQAQTQIDQQVRKKVKEIVDGMRSQLFSFKMPGSPEDSHVAEEERADEAGQVQSKTRLVSVLEDPPSSYSAAGGSAAVVPVSSDAPAASYMGKKLWLWSNTDDSQFCVSATVIGCNVQNVVVKIDNRYGQEISEEHTFAVQDALVHLSSFNEGMFSKNPDDPMTTPNKFRVLAVNDKIEAHPQISGIFIRVDDTVDMPVWHNDHIKMFMWRDFEMNWFLGPSPHDKMYISATAVRWPHEARRWQDMRGAVRVNLTICFKAYLGPSAAAITAAPQAAPPPSAGVGGAAGGRSGAGASGSGGAGSSSTAAASADASPAPGTSAAAGPSGLRAGDILSVAWGPDKEIEGYFNPVVVRVSDDVVTFTVDKDNGGFMKDWAFIEDNGEGTFPYDKVLLCRAAFINDTNIPSPHQGSFSAVYVTHASCNPKIFTGKYVETEQIMDGMPVYRKVQISLDRVKYLWRNDKLWIFGSFVDNEPVPYAVAEKSAHMPHLTREFRMRGMADSFKIFSYATKSAPQPQIAAATSSRTSASGFSVASAAGSSRTPAAGSSRTPAAGSSRTPAAGSSGASAAGSSAAHAAGISGASALDDSGSDEDVIELKEKQLLSISYHRHNEKEGFCIGTVKKVLEDVQYECHRARQGQLDGISSGRLSLQQALLYRKAYVTKVHIPFPHEGLFESVVVSHTDKHPERFAGVYKQTEMFMGEMPVYTKEDVVHYAVTHLWRSPTGKKWIFGRESEMNLRPEEGFAVAYSSSKWPHYVHAYNISGNAGKIFSYSIKFRASPAKSPPISVYNSSEEDAEDEDRCAKKPKTN